MTAAHQVSLAFTISQSFLNLMSIELVMLSNNLILYYPLLLPSIFLSIRVFSSELALHLRWSKFWSFSISSSFEYSGLISLGLADLTSTQSKGLSSTTIQNISYLALSLLYGPTHTWSNSLWSNSYMTTGKNHSFDYTDLCWQSDVLAL